MSEILTEKQIEYLKTWLNSEEGKTALLKAQDDNREVSRKIREMNNFNPELMYIPFNL